MKSFENVCKKCGADLSDEANVQHSEKCSCSEHHVDKTTLKEESPTENKIKHKSGCCCE